MYICVVRDDSGDTVVFSANTVEEINAMIAAEYSKEENVGVYVDEDDINLYRLAGKGKLEKVFTTAYSVRQLKVD